jgi:hypothetical protein
LGELAVLVATVEDLVHGDTIELLRLAYATHGFSVDAALVSSEQEELVIKTYLLYFLLPWTQDHQGNATAIVEFFPQAPQAYPGWTDTLAWVEDLKESVKYQHRGERSPFGKQDVYFRDFASMSHLVEKVIDGIGNFQDIECRMMKNMLLDLDPQRSDGRVSLTKFWSPFAKDEHYYFTETPEYLKHLGALDEADPRRPSVIVPNIVYARSNCLATSSGFHSVCCVNQCDALMESLEQGVAHPVASPARIAELVSGLPSETVAAPRNLSGSLLRKLDMIAAQHGGQVPLHGRMFAQFLHHAFPYECPMPHASGMDAQLTHEEWIELMGSDSTVTGEDIEHYAQLAVSTADAASPSGLGEVAMMWSEEEELLTQLDTEQLRDQEPGGRAQALLLGLLRFLAMVGASAATLATFWDSLRSSFFLARPRLGVEKGPAGSLPNWFGEASGAGPTKSHFI